MITSRLLLILAWERCAWKLSLCLRRPLWKLWELYTVATEFLFSGWIRQYFKFGWLNFKLRATSGMQIKDLWRLQVSTEISVVLHSFQMLIHVKWIAQKSECTVAHRSMGFPFIIYFLNISSTAELRHKLSPSIPAAYQDKNNRRCNKPFLWACSCCKLLSHLVWLW